MYRLSLGIDIDYMLFSMKHSVLATVNDKFAGKILQEAPLKAILDA
jgi:hypothetical protein